jgi:ribosomal protein S8E
MEQKIIVSSISNKHLAKAFYAELMAAGLKTRNSKRDNENLEADTCYFVVTTPNGKKTVSVVVTKQSTVNFDLPKGWTDAIKAIADLKEPVVEKVVERKEAAFKKGDIIIVSKDPKESKYPGYNAPAKGTIAHVCETEESGINTSGMWLHLGDSRGDSHIDAHLCRLATYKEICDYVKKSIPVDTYMYVFNPKKHGSINKVGDVRRVVSHSGQYFQLDNPAGSSSWEGIDSARFATKEEIARVATVRVSGYVSDTNKERRTVSFGCQVFTLDQLRGIRRLFDVPKTVKITIGTTEITAEMMDRLISSII